MKEYPWIQTRIDELGISQAETARRADMLTDHLNKTIKGKRGLEPEEALRLSNVLSVSIEEVITGEKIMKNMPFIIKQLSDRIFDLENAVSDMQDEFGHQRKREEKKQDINKPDA